MDIILVYNLCREKIKIKFKKKMTYCIYNK